MSDIDDKAPYDPEFYQRLNQINSQVGAPAVMPEDHAAIAVLAENLNAGVSQELPYDGDPVARRIAGQMVNEHFKAWEAAGRRNVYEAFCPESEATLYVLSYSGNRAWVTAIRGIEQMPDIRHDMRSLWHCDAVVTRRCGLRVGGMTAEYPVEMLAIKRGDYVCVFTACPQCLEHIHTGAGFNDDYIGPDHDWIDDRQPPKRDDLWPDTSYEA